MLVIQIDSATWSSNQLTTAVSGSDRISADNSSFPAAGQAFPGVTHWIAHLAAYAVIAFAYALGWQKQPAILVAVFVAALGAIHEYSEIFTHDHALEIADILVNCIGAGIGVALEQALVPATARA